MPVKAKIFHISITLARVVHFDTDGLHRNIIQIDISFLFQAFAFFFACLGAAARALKGLGPKASIS